MEPSLPTAQGLLLPCRCEGPEEIPKAESRVRILLTPAVRPAPLQPVGANTRRSGWAQAASHAGGFLLGSAPGANVCGRARACGLAGQTQQAGRCRWVPSSTRGTAWPGASERDRVPAHGRTHASLCGPPQQTAHGLLCVLARLCLPPKDASK